MERIILFLVYKYNLKRQTEKSNDLIYRYSFVNIFENFGKNKGNLFILKDTLTKQTSVI